MAQADLGGYRPLAKHAAQGRNILMKRILFVCAAVAALSGCATSTPAPAPSTVTVTAPAATTSSPASSAESTSAAPTSIAATTQASPTPSPALGTENTQAVTAEAQVAAEPYVVECIPGTPGPARWSDGHYGYSDYCFQLLGGPQYLEAEGAAGLPDPATIPVADGGTCPAAVCGYGHDANGNPNPSSGEIQNWWVNCTAANPVEYCRENSPY